MSQTVVLSKVLQIKKNEKKDAQLAHYKSLKLFEGFATDLYQLLQKKENAEVHYEEVIQETTLIHIVKEQMNIIESLNQQIIKLQDHVKKARNKMNADQMKLTHAHIEVKKFEKVIRQRNDRHKKINTKRDQTAMDDLSIRQYLIQRSGDENGEIY